MQKDITLVTGANGEIGHALVERLCRQDDASIVALDLHPLDEAMTAACHRSVACDVRDRTFLEELFDEYSFNTIYHLAAVLSTNAERKPEKAHRVNVDGTLNLLEFAMIQARRYGREIRFVYPSSIAVYGLPDIEVKVQAGAVREHEWRQPITMYGMNKLYGEQLGSYYTEHYRQLDEGYTTGGIDFRAIRFPGLISALTAPSGGTSDYVPELLHHAAQGLSYTCFVRKDTRIPFMVMPDAVKALLSLEAAPLQRLSQRVYNVTAFNPSAGEFYERLKDSFRDSQVSFKPHPKRQVIVDSWPLDTDDTAARTDWGWEPDYDLDRALEEYLIPTVKERYRTNA